jgi:hypothetical protein
MVVKATLEKQVSKISEIIQAFHTRIKEFEVCTTLGTPPEEKKQRSRKSITSTTSIKNMDAECTKLCKESTQLWTNLTEDLTLKFIEETLRNA